MLNSMTYNLHSRLAGENSEKEGREGGQKREQRAKEREIYIKRDKKIEDTTVCGRPDKY